MTTRRDILRHLALTSAATLLPAGVLRAAQHGGIIKRAVPKTGEKLPIVGLGTSASFRRLAENDDVGQLSDVIWGDVVSL